MAPEINPKSKFGITLHMAHGAHGGHRRGRTHSRGGSGMAPEVRPKPQITTRTNLDRHQEKIKPKSATNQPPPARYRTPKAQQDNKEVAFGTPEGRVFLPFMYLFMWEKPRNPRQVHLKIARFTQKPQRPCVESLLSGSANLKPTFWNPTAVIFRVQSPTHTLSTESKR